MSPTRPILRVWGLDLSSDDSEDLQHCTGSGYKGVKFPWFWNPSSGMTGAMGGFRGFLCTHQEMNVTVIYRWEFTSPNISENFEICKWWDGMNYSKIWPVESYLESESFGVSSVHIKRWTWLSSIGQYLHELVQSSVFRKSCQLNISQG